jgi:hypothetical protein
VVRMHPAGEEVSSEQKMGGTGVSPVLEKLTK